MGRHNAHAESAVRAGRFSLAAVALGIGAAAFGATGTAHADTDMGTAKYGAHTSRDANNPKPQSHRHIALKAAARADDPSTSAAPTRVVTVVSLASAKVKVKDSVTATASSSARPHGKPDGPVSLVLDAVKAVGREVENAEAAPELGEATVAANSAAAVTPTVPAPGDVVSTAYGSIGKWMLQPNGKISDYGGQKYNGKKVLEPVNVIIVDPTSTTTAAASKKLNAVMDAAGFGAHSIHSGGFTAVIDGTTYKQQPTALLEAYSDNDFTAVNDHGRIFGPDPLQTGSGYVWSGAFSTERVKGYFFWLPVHAYVSSNTARAALAAALIISGLATYGGMVELNNEYNTGTTTTGDHDGNAVVLILN